MYVIFIFFGFGFDTSSVILTPRGRECELTVALFALCSLLSLCMPFCIIG